MDSLIISVFEEQEDIFAYPLTTEQEARLFVKALHDKGCKYESIGKEVGGDRKAFEEWRGAGKNAVKDLLIKVLERINKPFQDAMASVGEKEDGSKVLSQLSVDEGVSKTSKVLTSRHSKLPSTAKSATPDIKVDQPPEAPRMNKKQQLELLLKQKYISKQSQNSRVATGTAVPFKQQTPYKLFTPSANSAANATSPTVKSLAQTSVTQTADTTSKPASSACFLNNNNSDIKTTKQSSSSTNTPSAPVTTPTTTTLGKSATTPTTTPSTKEPTTPSTTASTTTSTTTSTAPASQSAKTSTMTTKTPTLSQSLLSQLSSYTPNLVSLSPTLTPTATSSSAFSYSSPSIKTTSSPTKATTASTSTTAATTTSTRATTSKSTISKVATLPPTTAPKLTTTFLTTTTNTPTTTTTKPKSTTTPTTSPSSTATGSQPKKTGEEEEGERPPSPLTTSPHYQPTMPAFSVEEIYCKLNYNSDEEGGEGADEDDTPGSLFLLSDIPAGHMKVSKFTKFRIKLASSRNPINRFKQSLNFNPDLRMLANVKVAHRKSQLTKLRSSFAPFLMKNKNDWYWATLKQIFAAFDEAIVNKK